MKNSSISTERSTLIEPTGDRLKREKLINFDCRFVAATQFESVETTHSPANDTICILFLSTKSLPKDRINQSATTTKPSFSANSHALDDVRIRIGQIRSFVKRIVFEVNRLQAGAVVLTGA